MVAAQVEEESAELDGALKRFLRFTAIVDNGMMYIWIEMCRRQREAADRVCIIVYRS
jgi:hypothetical protein